MKIEIFLLMILMITSLIINIIIFYKYKKESYELSEYNNDNNDNNVNIFILCYNEELLLPKTVEHYKKYIPNCNITIYDNESIDNSVNIAKSLGCKVISWNSNNIIDDNKYRKIKNNCWKHITDGWIIVVDMDEWLCVTQEELNKEKEIGTSILKVKGCNMIGESQREDLKDINLHEIRKFVVNHYESKYLCFYRNKIKEINYNLGAHIAYPEGDIVYSNKYYINKHMEYLGLPFITKKMYNRYKRSFEMRKMALATHYTDDKKLIEEKYYKQLNESQLL